MSELLIGADHGAFELKEKIKEMFSTFDWKDLGTHSGESVDYADYAQSVCKAVLSKNLSSEEMLKPQAILLCGSGIGMSMAANRFAGIRAALVSSVELAEITRKHNASNVLCLGARFLDQDDAIEIVKTWLSTDFEGGRHIERIKGIEKV